MHVELELVSSGGNTAGFVVPNDVVEALGGGKRPKVVVTVEGFTYRSSIASMGGVFMLGMSAERRKEAGTEPGHTYDVTLTLDTEERVLEVPADLQAALDADPAAKAYFATLSYSSKQRHVLAIEGAKAADTRARRIAKSVALFAEGRS